MTYNAFKNPAYFLSTHGEAYESYTGTPHQVGDKPLTKKEGKEREKAQAADYLRSILQPGSTVYTILRHTSSSGMLRCISLHAVVNGEVVRLDYHACRAMGDTTHPKYGGIRVGGCGMDMGFHLVYNLGRYLWPNGTKTPHGSRNGYPDSDGGYALQHKWL